MVKTQHHLFACRRLAQLTDQLGYLTETTLRKLAGVKSHNPIMWHWRQSEQATLCLTLKAYPGSGGQEQGRMLFLSTRPDATCFEWLSG